MAPEQKTRTGSARMIRRMRSKKWQHFSTMVPPVLAAKRFQSPTLGRKGKRCSRIDSIRSRPASPACTCSTKRGDGRHEAVLHAGPEHRRAPAAWAAAQRASSTVVHSGFSQRMCRPGAAKACSSTARWVWLGEAISTASKPARRQERARVGVGGARAPPQRLDCRRRPAKPRPGRRGQRAGVGQEFEVADVLATHHARADEADPQAVRHERGLTHERRPLPRPAPPLGKGGLTASPMAWGMWRFRGDDLAAAQATCRGGARQRLQPSGHRRHLRAGQRRALRRGGGAARQGAGGGAGPARPHGAGDQGRHRDGRPLQLQRRLSGARLRGLAEAAGGGADRALPDPPPGPAGPPRRGRRRAGPAARPRARSPRRGSPTTPPRRRRRCRRTCPSRWRRSSRSSRPLAIAPLSDGVLDQAMERDLAVLAWSPLGGGRLGDAETTPAAEVAPALRRGGGGGVPASAVGLRLDHGPPVRAVPIVGRQNAGADPRGGRRR